MVKKTFYLTTAIDYVNAKPHVGHAFEKCLADAIARWHRLKGENVFFLTGVDENAQKNVQAAEVAGIPVKQFIDKNTAFFQELCKKLNVNYDKFIRTTAKEHADVVHDILKKLIKNGDIYKGKYEGYYCTGCESFITEKDLVQGKCPEHNKKPDFMSEEAYFFKLSKYQDKLIKFVEEYIVPESKKNEILSRLKEPLKDVCISRKGAKWGVDFPYDKDYKVWVWVDALINYISGAKEKWPADLHIIGKGINWFHSVIWPALLMSAKIELPKKLLVHGYLTLGDKKISKSLGNVIDPLELLEKYQTDSVRYSLLKCSVFEDSDYSEEILIERHNKELANKLGNLISRVSTLVEQYGLEEVDFKKIDVDIHTQNIVIEVTELIERFELDKALNLIFAFIDTLNQWVQKEKIWETGSKKDLYELVTGIRLVAVLLWPFLPETSEKIAKQFGFKISLDELNKPLKEIKVKKSEILFKKIEQKIIKDEIQGIKIMDTIKFDEWAKLDLRVGKILKAEDIEGADKLYKLTINVGEKRTVVAGIKQYYSKEELKGKNCILFCNLESRTMKGIKSEGMILAAVNKDHSKVLLIQPDKDIEPGSKVS